jgi:hypothetical protein
MAVVWTLGNIFSLLVVPYSELNLIPDVIIRNNIGRINLV